MHKLPTDPEISTQFEIKCLAQGNIEVWQKEAGIEPTPFWSSRQFLSLSHSCLGMLYEQISKTWLGRSGGVINQTLQNYNKLLCCSGRQSGFVDAVMPNNHACVVFFLFFHYEF
ncbi:hypothetical protein XENOCAPTIV_017388 [Xenoophorus captivus]|uniref:MHC class I-like antigen recognition-like domain-containing protein n=1 Tax=Xenoophorus captivus TaxID=1517983 RepID=A0ABV0QEK9_9TELE